MIVADPSFGGTPLRANQPQVIASRYPLTLAGRSPPNNKVGNKIIDTRATVTRITEKQKMIDHVIELTAGEPVKPIIRSLALPNSRRERGALSSASCAGVPVSGGAC